MENEPPIELVTIEPRRPIVSIGRGTAILAIGTLCLLLFNFVGRVAIARTFSVASWGDFNLGIALTGFLTIIAILGLHQAMARTLSYERDPGVRRNIVRWGLLLTGTSAVLSSVTVYLLSAPLAAVFAGANSAQLTQVFQLMSVTIGFTLMCLFLAALFQGFEDAAPNAIFNYILGPGLFVGFVFLSLYLHLGFNGALEGYVASIGVAFAVFVVYTLRRLPALLPKVPRVPTQFPRQLGQLSVTLWGATSLAFVTGYADTLILGFFRPASDVGLYTAAMTLARLLLVGGAALMFIYLPVASRLMRTQDLVQLRATYVTAARWMVAITFPLFLLFALDPQLSIGLVFGTSYDQGSLALSILVWGAFISMLVGPVTACLAGMAYGRTMLLTSTASAVVNVALSFTLIPLFGLLGAAVTWTAARVVFTLLGSYALWRSDLITPFGRTLTIPLTAAMAFGLPLFAFLSLYHLPWWAPIPLVFVAGAVFPLACLATRTLEREDLILTQAAERLFGQPLPGLRRFLERFVSVENRAVVPPG